MACRFHGDDAPLLLRKLPAKLLQAAPPAVCAGKAVYHWGYHVLRIDFWIWIVLSFFVAESGKIFSLGYWNPWNAYDSSMILLILVHRMVTPGVWFSGPRFTPGCLPKWFLLVCSPGRCRICSTQIGNQKEKTTSHMVFRVLGRPLHYDDWWCFIL